MDINKGQLLQFLRARGEDRQADVLERQLPEQANSDDYADLLGALGVDIAGFQGQAHGGGSGGRSP